MNVVPRMAPITRAPPVSDPVRLTAVLLVYILLGWVFVVAYQLAVVAIRLLGLLIDMTITFSCYVLFKLKFFAYNAMSPFGVNLSFLVFCIVQFFWKARRLASISFSFTESAKNVVPDIHLCTIQGPGVDDRVEKFVGAQYSFSIVVRNSHGDLLRDLPPGITLEVTLKGVCKIIPILKKNVSKKKRNDYRRGSVESKDDDDDDYSDAGNWIVYYTARRSGKYYIEAKFVNKGLHGSLPLRPPLPVIVNACKLSVRKSSFTLPLVATLDVQSEIVINARDKFGNTLANFDPLGFSVELEEEQGAMKRAFAIECIAERFPSGSVKGMGGNGGSSSPSSRKEGGMGSNKSEEGCYLHMVHPRSGLFRVVVRYNGSHVGFIPSSRTWSVTGDVSGEAEKPFLTVLDSSGVTSLNKALTRRRVQMLGNLAPEGKGVTIILTSRVLLIRGSFLKFIPVRYLSVKLGEIFNIFPDPVDPHRISITAGASAQTYTLVLSTPEDRNLFYVAYTHFRAKRHLFFRDGSDGLAFRGEFVEKRRVFEAKLLEHVESLASSPSVIRIRRDQLLADAYASMRKWSDASFRGKIQVKFVGEEGVDWGGLRREFLTIMSRTLFSPRSGLFTFLEGSNETSLGKGDDVDDETEFGSRSPTPPPDVGASQKFIHPTPGNGAQDIDRMFYAGKFLGLILIESARGDVPIHIPCPFTRSFCKQILGLGVHFTDFVTDMPEFYRSKVKYLLDNNLDNIYEEQGVELFFEEEMWVTESIVKMVKEKPDSEKLKKVNTAVRKRRAVPLKPNGSKIKVDEKNKREYLQLIARYRLVTRTEAMTKSFLKGLFSLLPEDLFSFFDENELELVFCGIPQIDVSDFKRCTKIRGFNVPSGTTPRLVEWFWAAVENMTQDERAKLIQFITGSAHLPKVGSRNCIILQRSLVLPKNSLPISHTCFYQMDLPEYDSYQQLLSRLLIAVTEGSEGFGFV